MFYELEKLVGLRISLFVVLRCKREFCVVWVKSLLIFGYFLIVNLLCVWEVVYLYDDYLLLMILSWDKIVIMVKEKVLVDYCGDVEV